MAKGLVNLVTSSCSLKTALLFLAGANKHVEVGHKLLREVKRLYLMPTLLLCHHFLLLGAVPLL